MGFLAGAGNDNLIGRLQRKPDESVILYAVDGFAYYARIAKVLKDDIAVLGPGAGQTAVIVRPPDQTFVPQGSSASQEEFTFIDLRRVVAVTWHLTAMPIGFVLG